LGPRLPFLQRKHDSEVSEQILTAGKSRDNLKPVETEKENIKKLGISLARKSNTLSNGGTREEPQLIPNDIGPGNEINKTNADVSYCLW
jgi:hypothetical protein